MANPAKETVAAPVAPAVDPAIQAAWEAHLKKAEEQRIQDGTHHIFLEQKERGEFDKIPDLFIKSLSA